MSDKTQERPDNLGPGTGYAAPAAQSEYFKEEGSSGAVEIIEKATPISDHSISQSTDLTFQNQLDLFRIPRNKDESWKWSNITGIYDLTPKMTVSHTERKQPVVRRKIDIKMPDSKTKLGFVIEIKPAIQEDGSFRYPGVLEEAVENALKYMAAQKGGENIDNLAISIDFTLYELRKVLKNVFSKKYSHNQIREALITLSESHLSVRPDNGDESLTFKSSRLSALTIHDKGKYPSMREAGHETRCLAVFHPLFANDVRNGFFRYYNLQRKTMFKKDVTEMLYDRVSFHWRYASVDSTYTFSAETFLAGTPYGDGENDSNKSRRLGRVRQAVQELQSTGLISRYVEEIRYKNEYGKQTSKVVDLIFELTCSEEYQKELIKLNGIQKRIRRELENHEKAKRLM